MQPHVMLMLICDLRSVLLSAMTWLIVRPTKTCEQSCLSKCSHQNQVCRLLCLQGALALLNVETGLDTVSEVEAIGAFVVLLLLTEDLGGKAKQ